MALGIYILPVICIMIKVSTSATIVSDTQTTCESQLGEMHEEMCALESSINWVFSEVMDTLKHAKNQVEDLKSVFNAQFNCERNKSSVYTVHYSLKNQTEAELCCQAEGSHLVSFQTLNEYNHVFQLIPRPCSGWGFWTSALKGRNDTWIWEISEELIIDEVWWTGQPSGDGVCAHMIKRKGDYRLNDLPCQKEMCFVCESA